MDIHMSKNGACHRPLNNEDNVHSEQQQHTSVTIRIDDDGDDDEDDDDDGHHHASSGGSEKCANDNNSCCHNAKSAACSWTDNVSDIQFIDDSNKSSVVSERRRHSSTATALEDSPLSPDSCLPMSTAGNMSSIDPFYFHSQQTYSPTTFVMSDNEVASLHQQQQSPTYRRHHHLVSALMTQEEYMAIHNHQQSFYHPPAQTSVVPVVHLKSCLLEFNAADQKVTCSCVPSARQITFQKQCHGGNAKMCQEVTLPNGKYVNYVDDKIAITPSNDGRRRHNSFDVLSQYSLDLEKDCRYYFQHPFARLFIAYFVIFCNFLIFAEDPVSHSHTESKIPIVGNVFAFIFTKYPPEWGWTFVKVFLWSSAIATGMVIGKNIIHKLLLARICRLKMFHEEQGSWMIMFLTVILSLYIFSYIYNLFLIIGHSSSCKYQISNLMGITNSSLMKACACGTWLGDFVTAWMVTDMMLQDNFYPDWAPGFRAFWRTGNTRIVTFWGGAVGMSALVITLIVSDLINWDKLNRDFVATTELSRAYLASCILVMDLLIVMQDWDFPHFTSTLNINLPGMKIKAVKLNFCTCLQWFWGINITGKWFNYGIIFLVMILDLNMWKNQIFYEPTEYAQYLGPDFKVYTVSNLTILATGNHSLWTYKLRSAQENPKTNQSYLEGDMLMNSRYLGYSMAEKCTAFLPSMLGFFMFGLLVYLYGRFPPKDADERRRYKKHTRSSWFRDRGSFRSQEEQVETTMSPPSKHDQSGSCCYTDNNNKTVVSNPQATKHDYDNPRPIEALITSVSRLIFMQHNDCVAQL